MIAQCLDDKSDLDSGQITQVSVPPLKLFFSQRKKFKYCVEFTCKLRVLIACAVFVGPLTGRLRREQWYTSGEGHREIHFGENKSNGSTSSRTEYRLPKCSPKWSSMKDVRMSLRPLAKLGAICQFHSLAIIQFPAAKILLLSSSSPAVICSCLPPSVSNEYVSISSIRRSTGKPCSISLHACSTLFTRARHRSSWALEIAGSSLRPCGSQNPKLLSSGGARPSTVGCPSRSRSRRSSWMFGIISRRPSYSSSLKSPRILLSSMTRTTASISFPLRTIRVASLVALPD